MIIWLIIHTIYEIKDILNSYYFKIKYNETKPYLYILFSNNSYINSIGDTIYAILGVLFGVLLCTSFKKIETYILLAIMTIVALMIIYNDKDYQKIFAKINKDYLM